MSEIPTPIIVTELAEGVRYHFRLRRRGVFVWMGLVHLVGGVIGIAFMLFWLGALGANLGWNAGAQNGQGFILLFLAGGCFMLGVWLTALGITRLVGHSGSRPCCAGRLCTIAMLVRPGSLSPID